MDVASGDVQASGSLQTGAIQLGDMLRVGSLRSEITFREGQKVTGTIHARNIRVAKAVDVDSLTGQLKFQQGRLMLHDCTASLYGGKARGTISFLLDGPDQLEIDLDKVSGVKLKRLVRRWPALRRRVSGELYGQGKLKLLGRRDGRRELVGSGDFQILAPVPVGPPLRKMTGKLYVGRELVTRHAVLAPSPLRVQATRPDHPQVLIQFDPRSRVAGGRISGDAWVYFHKPVRYEIGLKFHKLDLGTVANSVIQAPSDVDGRLSGHIFLHGTDRGAQDAEANMYLVLSDANLWNYPIFNVLAVVLNLDLTRTGGFREGQGRATLSNSTLNFREFWVAGDAATFFGTGQIRLDGQINLEVVGSTETPIPKRIPILGTVRRALDRMQQELFKIRLTGTLDNPNATPVPVYRLSEPAVKFFGEMLDGTTQEKLRDRFNGRR